MSVFSKLLVNTGCFCCHLYLFKGNIKPVAVGFCGVAIICIDLGLNIKNKMQSVCVV